MAWAPVGFVAARTIAEDGRLYGSGVRAHLITLVLGAAYVLYEVGLVATRGQTVGKMAMRIQVVRADGGIAPPGWRLSIRRYIVFYGPALLAWLVPLPRFVEGGVVMAWTVYVLVTIVGDAQRRGVHDWKARTRVVRRQPALPPPVGS